MGKKEMRGNNYSRARYLDGEKRKGVVIENRKRGQKERDYDRGEGGSVLGDYIEK